MVTGLILQAASLLWLGLLLTPATPYVEMVPAFMLAGIGMALFFVPLASLVLGSVPSALEGVASGTNSAFREVGGVLGIAVLGAVFSSSGSYARGSDYVKGLTPAILVGAAARPPRHPDRPPDPGLRRARSRVQTEEGPAEAVIELSAA